MTKAELNQRFLKVGYEKRDTEGVTSDRWNRKFMGRKGIGKLSVFSIAKTICVYSTKNGESHGFRLEVGPLEAAIRQRKAYHPARLDVPPEYSDQGTVLVLSDLKRTRADLTANALRLRLARRFAVLGSKPADQGGFQMRINDKAITYADREDLQRLEYIWEFGSERLPDDALPAGVERLTINDNAVKGHREWTISGWIGTARQPADLAADDEAGSLRNVIVLARKRPIQEGIVEKLNFSRIFTSYVTGQIEADFLDLDGDFDDIATSDRQRLIEDDPRVKGLQDLLRKAFKQASDEWSKLRPKKQAQDYLKNFPLLRQWVDERDAWQQDAAEKMIAPIAGLTLDDDTAGSQRANLFRSGVLAFERMALRASAQELEQATSLRAEDIIPLLNRQDLYETALWGDILKSRVEAIEKLQALTEAGELEKAIQQHLFDNLWLLDASWERATVSVEMERSVKRFHEGVLPTYKDGEPIDGRVDIRYSTLSGRHVIVELKKYERKVTHTELKEQGEKYYAAVEDVLKRTNRAGQEIEVIFVLGHPPTVKVAGKGSDEDAIRGALANINGSYRLYDDLINSARHQYKDYLEATDKVGSLTELLDSLSASADGSPESESDSDESDEFSDGQAELKLV